MPDSTVSQTALVIIAIAVSIHSLVLLSAAWLAMRALKSAQAKLDHRLDLLEARADSLTEATQRVSHSIERCVTQFSTIFQQGERLAGAVASAVATPKALLLAGAASRIVGNWRRNRARRA